MGLKVGEWIALAVAVGGVLVSLYTMQRRVSAWAWRIERDLQDIRSTTAQFVELQRTFNDFAEESRRDRALIHAAIEAGANENKSYRESLDHRVTKIETRCDVIHRRLET